MKAASLQEIKQELINLPPKQVLELCLRLTRFKKENKELLTYLLFEADDQQGYIDSAKIEIRESFADVSVHNYYLAKKSLRKILRSITKYGKHMGSKSGEAELLLFFCKMVKEKGLQMQKSTALANLYKQQIKKINTLAQGVHEDLQYEFQQQLQEL